MLSLFRSLVSPEFPAGQYDLTCELRVFLLKSNTEDLTNLVALVKEGYLVKT